MGSLSLIAIGENRKMEFVLELSERVSATSTRRRAFEAKRDRLMDEPTLPLNKADREVIMLALSEWILFTHAIAFDPDEKGYTRQEITRMRNNIVKVKKLLARLREAPLPWMMTARSSAIPPLSFLWSNGLTASSPNRSRQEGLQVTPKFRASFAASEAV